LTNQQINQSINQLTN